MAYRLDVPLLLAHIHIGNLPLLQINTYYHCTLTDIQVRYTSLMSWYFSDIFIRQPRYIRPINVDQPDLRNRVSICFNVSSWWCSYLQAYDPTDTGFMDTEILRSIFDNLGFGQVSYEDLAVLVEAADGDGDGRVSLQDFRGMCNSVGKREVVAKDTGNQHDTDQAQELS